MIVFDDMIADMINNKKLNPIVTELFIRGRKLNKQSARYLNLMNNQPDIDKIYLYAKDPYEKNINI